MRRQKTVLAAIFLVFVFASAAVTVMTAWAPTVLACIPGGSDGGGCAPPP